MEPLLNFMDRNFSRYILICTWCIASLPASAQVLLNGDLENNNAPSGIDQLDLSDTPLNALVPHCHSHGSMEQRHLHLITSANFGGPPSSGDWFVAIRGEQLSFELSQPLVPNVTYHLTFYDRSLAGYCPTRVQVGITDQIDQAGLTLATSEQLPAFGEWTFRKVSFTVPFQAEYLTVRGQEPFCLVQLDRLCLSNSTPCVDIHAFEMPNIFTPNDDGRNDIFSAIAVPEVEEMMMTIFDRWGMIVFEGDVKLGWDGNSNGRPCSDGSYFWKVHFIYDGVERFESGSFILAR